MELGHGNQAPEAVSPKRLSRSAYLRREAVPISKRYHMNVLVTDGAGFIGSHVFEHHLHRGDGLGVVDDLSTSRRDVINSGRQSIALEKHIIHGRGYQRRMARIDFISPLSANPCFENIF